MSVHGPIAEDVENPHVRSHIFGLTHLPAWFLFERDDEHFYEPMMPNTLNVSDGLISYELSTLQRYRHQSKKEVPSDQQMHQDPPHGFKAYIQHALLTDFVENPLSLLN